MILGIKRLLLAGLISWVIMIISGLAMVPVVGHDMEEALSRFGLSPLSGGAMIYFALQSLITSMVMVYLYFALLPGIKNRLGTAVIVAFLVWLLAYFFANAAMVVYGFMPLKLTVVGTIWGFFELLLGCVIGTKFY